MVTTQPVRRAVKRRPKKSGTRTPAIPTLAQMVREGQADADTYKQRTRRALEYWFRQSRRLNIARTYYRLRGDRFQDFARRIGVDRSSAFELVKLHEHRARIISLCKDEAEKAAKRGESYYYPGWETALSWCEKRKRKASWVTWPGYPEEGKHKRQYWLTPPELYQSLNAEFKFDFDPCPFPLPYGWDALKMAWANVNYVNAPFSRHDGPGLTAFVRKAIAQQQLGKTSVLIVPVPELLNMLFSAEAEARPLGRVRFLDTQSGEPCDHPFPCTGFILRGKSQP
jgi:hypothetical protein